MSFKYIYAVLAAMPVGLLAFSTGPVTKRTGALVDGGLNCSVCHNTFGPANSDPRGSVVITAVNYTPGVKQTVTVSVQHPEAIRWGFELTARPVAQQTKVAGSFTTNDLVRVRCDTTPASDAPCNGVLEFAEHNNAPFTTAGAGFTFSVDWTPPATDVGDIVFFAAGNAANGDGTSRGDRIYTTSVVISSKNACSLSAKPTVSAVVNAASLQPGLAPNALVAIFGRGFTASTTPRLAQYFDVAGNKFPTQLVCVAVEIDGQRAPLTYVRSDQINAQMPSGSNPGPVTIKVILNPGSENEVSSDTTSVQLQKQSPAFFTFDGKSIVAVLTGTPKIVANSSVVASGTAAKPGDIVSLYVTGCGLTDPAYQAGEIATGPSSIPSAFTISIGGTALSPSDVMYAGLAKGFISGLYQFDVRIPDAAADGDLPVTLQVGGVTSQSGTTIPVKK